MGKGYGITALTLGILSILLIFMIIPGIFLGPAAIIIGVIGLDKDDTKGMSIAGIITGAIGTILGVGLVLLIFFYLMESGYTVSPPPGA